MTGQKRQLEKARQEKQAAKRERRQTRAVGSDEADVVDDRPEFDQEQVLADLADLHRRYDEEQIGLEAFEVARAELVQRLRVD